MFFIVALILRNLIIFNKLKDNVSHRSEKLIDQGILCTHETSVVFSSYISQLNSKLLTDRWNKRVRDSWFCLRDHKFQTERYPSYRFVLKICVNSCVWFIFPNILGYVGCVELHFMIIVSITTNLNILSLCNYIFFCIVSPW